LLVGLAVVAVTHLVWRSGSGPALGGAVQE